MLISLISYENYSKKSLELIILFYARTIALLAFIIVCLIKNNLRKIIK